MGFHISRNVVNGIAGLLLGFTLHVAFAQEVPKFPISRFLVEGNTRLPAKDLDDLLVTFSGPGKDFGDVQQALEALEGLYKKRGYSTVSVILPEQVLERGEVHLRVIEGRIRALKIDGNRFFDTENIRASLPTLNEGGIPFIDDVSANLRVANENPAKKLTLQFSPGEEDEDLDAVIRVTDDKPWKFSSTLDNTGTIQTGRSRLGLSLQHANMFNRDQVMTLQYQTSPEKPRDVNVMAVAYRVPLYALGDSLDFYGTYSDVNAGTISAGFLDLAVTGKGSVLGGRYTLNLKRHGDYEHSLAFSLDQKVFKNSIVAGAAQLGNDLSVQPMGAHYSGRYALPNSETAFNLSFIQNIPWGHKGGQSDFAKVRTGADTDYQVVRGGLTYSHLLAQDWQWRAAASTQWAAKPLIPGELFGMGGSTSVRGFLEREVSADRGHQETLELYSPELCASLADQRCRVLAFYDMGGVHRLQPLVGEQTTEHISSAGLGLRWAHAKNLAFQADYGQVLQPGGTQRRGDWRVHGRLGFFF